MRTPGVLIKVATLVHASPMLDNAASLDRGGDAMPPTGWCASFVPRQNTSGKMSWWTSILKYMETRSSPVDELSRAAADHDRGAHRGTGDNRWHDGGIGNAQTADAVNAKFAVDDAVFIGANAARADRVTEAR